MTKRICVDITSEGNVAIASFTGSCISDVEEITNASMLLKEHMETARPDKIIFDFGQVKFFSSQVLGLLLEARGQLQAAEGRVLVCGLNSQLQRVFRITNLDKIFTFYPDQRAALTASAGHD